MKLNDHVVVFVIFVEVYSYQYAQYKIFLKFSINGGLVSDRLFF